MSATYDDIGLSNEYLWFGVSESPAREVGYNWKTAMASFREAGLSLAETLLPTLWTPFDNVPIQLGTADITSKVEAVLCQLALQRVRLSRLAETRNYLVEHPDLLGLLPSLYKAVSEHFPRSQQRLEYYQDPQYDDDKYLILSVLIDAYDLITADKIDTIAEKYSEIFAGISGWVLIIPELAQ